MSSPEAPATSPRKIIHLDMDCFYAAIEVRDRPELKELPVAVGGSSGRGVLTTCNYVARTFGCRSAMPVFQARRLCPDLIILPTRFDVYRRESARIRELMRALTPLVEPLSLDEAYLDVTGHDRYAWDLARELRSRIHAETGLTASAGIAPNKLLAKIASDWRKPDGQFAITPDQVAAFMPSLPLRKLWGVGPKTAAKLEAQGLTTCGDLQPFGLAELIARFGRLGEELYHQCRGADDRPVVADRIRKSLSNERTFATNLPDLTACREALLPLIAELQEELRTKAPDRAISTLVTKVKFHDFQQMTRERAGMQPDAEVFLDLLATAFAERDEAVRLLGVGVRFREARHDEGDAAARQLDLDLPLP